ncbi:MAG: flavin reductase [Firmicutes bacterium]|nr:flavin reductase [Bacillota bacterium]
MNSKTTRKLTYGLFVLTAHEDGKDNGCIINTAMQLTTTPNRVSIAVNKENHTHDMIMRTKKFTVSIISEDADFELFKHFGFQSGKDVDKFADFKDCKRGHNGLNYITKGTNGFISAWVQETVDLGTHTLFIGGVTDMEVLSEVPSVTYAYYQSDIKPKPQPKKSEKTVWRCVICSYEYEGETIPEDFVCPICKHTVEDFVKVE